MKETIEIREAFPGEASLVIAFYYKLFEEEYQFKPITEGYFMESMLDYFSDMTNNKLWVAVLNDQIVGSLSVVKRGEGEGQLRMFGIKKMAQGKGLVVK